MGDASFVYVIGAESGPRKIGMSADPSRRAALLQTGSPYPLAVLHAVRHERAAAVEAYAHRLLRQHSTAGEWFDVTTDAAVDAITRAITAVDSGEKPQSGTVEIGLRTYPSVKAAAERAAKADRRSLSSFIRLALERHLVQAGYLPENGGGPGVRLRRK